MKTDAQIKLDILDELTFLPGIDETQIGVIVEDGVVTLTGFVDIYSKKVATEKQVKSIKGVKAVAEDIIVKFNKNNSKSNKAITKAAVKALEWNICIPKGALMLSVNDGYVYLKGKLTWDYQRNEANYTVQNLNCVKGIINNIELSPTIEPYETSKKIQKAFERSANLKVKEIRVQTDGSIVKLRGIIHSHQGKKLAERIAYKAEGVTKVQNDIKVMLYPELGL